MDAMSYGDGLEKENSSVLYRKIELSLCFIDIEIRKKNHRMHTKKIVYLVIFSIIFIH